MNSLAYALLIIVLIRHKGRHSLLAKAIDKDQKGTISTVIYAIAVGLCWVNAYISLALYVIVAIIWFLPDRRIEKQVIKGEPGRDD